MKLYAPGPPAVAALASAVWAGALLTAAAPASGQGDAAPAAAQVRFAVSYNGSGTYGTSFTAHPPNPDGADDRNTARDWSTQRWSLAFKRALAVPACNPAATPDPCAAVAPLVGATGRVTLTGRIRHKHVDGLYRQLDESARCDLRVSTRTIRPPYPTIGAAYDPAAQTLTLTATDPISGPLSVFPTTCPGRVRPIDRIYDNLFTPGFSFAPGWGPERYFVAAPIVIPLTTLRSARRLAFPVRRAPGNAPPAGCAVRHPAYERCHTGGSWRGTLVLSARP